MAIMRFITRNVCFMFKTQVKTSRDMQIFYPFFNISRTEEFAPPNEKTPIFNVKMDTNTDVHVCIGCVCQSLN